MPKELPIDFNTPPPSQFSDSWADEQMPPPPSVMSVGRDLPPLPDTKTSWSYEDSPPPLPGMPTLPEVSNNAGSTPERSRRGGNWKRPLGRIALAALALGSAAGVFKAATSHEAAARDSAHTGTEQVVDYHSPLETAYDAAEIEESDTPYEYVSGSRIADIEKDRSVAGIERNKGEFIKGVKLSSGLKINFFEAHITPQDQNDKLEIDGRAVEQISDYILKSSSELPDTNPYSSKMKELKAKADNGELDGNLLTVIVSTQGECLSPDKQEIINDDLGLKGSCESGSTGGVEANVRSSSANEQSRVKGENLLILLSNFKTATETKSELSAIADDSTVEADSHDPKYLVKSDAEAVGFAHEFSHALVDLAGVQLDSDQEHQLLVNPMQNKVTKLLIATPGASQQGENRFISPFSIAQR
jgi:hypothetical protein